MPVRRFFRGQPVKRTRCFGSHILVTFRSPVPGTPGPRTVVPLRDYLAERKATFFRSPQANPS